MSGLSSPVRASVILAVTTVLTGGLCGWLWAAITPLPGYTLREGRSAFTTERGLTEFIIGDVTFSAIGLVAGIGLGAVAWRAFGRTVGWPAVPIGAAAAALAGMECWGVGLLFGPSNFQGRLGAAAVGDTVPIDLALRSPVALVIWVLGACGALLVITAIVRDSDEGYPVRLPWSRP